VPTQILELAANQLQQRTRKRSIKLFIELSIKAQKMNIEQPSFKVLFRQKNAAHQMKRGIFKQTTN